ncbi:hypothetical protein Cgig2_000124 [Carnegiea gigantea]|uniref:MI domain-containing protein n=1 Tax=Carnegiea gigantea TaxID=171969 RepID=A0A9Q1QUB6_9CARY|nr:hypothetical protein Cgig2_000124 [Carnegiea gigantea]
MEFEDEHFNVLVYKQDDRVQLHCSALEPHDRLTHEVSPDDEIDPEISIDILKADPNFLENERRYEELRKSILEAESEDKDESDAGSDDDNDEEGEDDEAEEQRLEIKDVIGANLINLRRTTYLIIKSSANFEEAGHKLLKIKLEPGQEMELCIMLLECAARRGNMIDIMVWLNKVYEDNFGKCFG